MPTMATASIEVAIGTIRKEQSSGSKSLEAITLLIASTGNLS